MTRRKMFIVQIHINTVKSSSLLLTLFWTASAMDPPGGGGGGGGDHPVWQSQKGLRRGLRRGEKY